MVNKKKTRISDIFLKSYDFSNKRTEGTQYFIVTFEVFGHRSNGKPRNIDNYKLYIKREGDQYTCKKILFNRNDKPVESVPSLAGWSYNFDANSLNEEELDDQGQMLGIPHSKFENLKDSAGKKLSIEAQYQVYSAFSYFHSWCNMIAEKYTKDLKKIGDSIKNDQSSVESPINLGSIFLDGSKFMHGLETIDFKGFCVVDDVICAIICYDERGGGFKMHMKPMPLLRIKTTSGTRYSGDIFIDLDSLHVKKVDASVTDISKTTMYGIPVDISVLVTTLNIKNVTKNVFNKD
jgi:hypothetical protein